MTEPARSAEDRPAGSAGAGLGLGPAVGAGLRGGVTAFAVATLVGVAIGLIEFAASGGAYRLWTWVKVGFLYVVSFCTASLRVSVLAPREHGARAPEVIDLRFSFLLGTLLLLWLLARAGREVARRGDARAIAAGAVAAIVGFAAPVFAIALPATLRFPGLLHTEVAPVLWQAALFPAAVAVSGVGAGVFLERRDRIAPSVVAIVRGGWRMFVWSLVLAFVGFLVLAAVKVGPTGAYAREMQAEGRVGVLSVTHHVLLLPNQSLWILTPSMGGSTEVSFGDADHSTVSIGRVDLGSNAAGVAGVAGEPSVPLGGGFYLFLLVPALATFVGGRRAGRGGSGAIPRMGLGAGAGLVFALLMAAGAWASAVSMPIPALGWAPVSIEAAMPSAAVLAAAWGVGGGVLGGLSAPLGASGPSQAGVPPPGPG